MATWNRLKQLNVSFFQVPVFFTPRRSWGGLQCHHHAPRMLGFQRHPRGSPSQSVHIPYSHPSVGPSSVSSCALPPVLQCSKSPALVFWAQLASTTPLLCVKCPSGALYGQTSRIHPGPLQPHSKDKQLLCIAVKHTWTWINISA